MGAGVMVEKYQTKDISRIRDGLTALPWTGPLFLLAVFALCAVPPFGIFRSEFMIVAGGMSSAHGWSASILVVLVTFAFFGLAIALTRMLSAPAGAGTTPVAPGEPSVWMVVPVVAAVAVLTVLGIHPPHDLVALLNAGAAQLQGASR